jgi:aminocarboxymuconate-semialdehyde decarboxylase
MVGWIDVHAHVVPDVRVPASLAAEPRWPRLVTSPTSGDVMISGSRFRTVRRAAWDLEARLSDLDADDVEHQVISPMPELFSYWAPPDDAEIYCGLVNEWIAAAVRASQGRLSGLGMVPMQSVEHGARGLEAVADLGLLGVEVGSNIRGILVGDARFDPFFDEAERLGLVVFVHAFHPPYLECVPQTQLANAVTFPPEIAAAAGALVANGVAARLRRARLLVSHGGGGLPSTVGRLEHFWQGSPEVRSLVGEHPRTALARMWFDSLVFGAGALRHLVDIVGATQVVAGTDHPFVTGGLDHVPTGETKERWQETTWRNARRLLWPGDPAIPSSGSGSLPGRRV